MLEATPAPNQVMRQFAQFFHSPNAIHRLWQAIVYGLVPAILMSVIGLFVVYPQFNAAHASQDVSFRVSRLETENRMVQSRLNQLEAQIRQLGRTSDSRGGNVPDLPPPVTSDLSSAAEDPMFDQLATLVIETRQDMFALQERVTELERQLPPHQSGDGL